jgi:hypothetical protein
MDIYEILDEIEQAYPEDIFPDTTSGEREDVMERYPGFIGRTSAMMGRHLARVIREKLALAEGERLRNTARQLLDYRDRYGAREFHRHFGVQEMSGERFAYFLREFLAEGDPSKPENPEHSN